MTPFIYFCQPNELVDKQVKYIQIIPINRPFSL